MPTSFDPSMLTGGAPMATPQFAPPVQPQFYAPAAPPFGPAPGLPAGAFPGGGFPPVFGCGGKLDTIA